MARNEIGQIDDHGKKASKPARTAGPGKGDARPGPPRLRRCPSIRNCCRCARGAAGTLQRALLTLLIIAALGWHCGRTLGAPAKPDLLLRGCGSGFAVRRDVPGGEHASMACPVASEDKLRPRTGSRRADRTDHGRARPTCGSRASRPMGWSPASPALSHARFAAPSSSRRETIRISPPCRDLLSQPIRSAADRLAQGYGQQRAFLPQYPRSAAPLDEQAKRIRPPPTFATASPSRGGSIPLPATG